MKRLLAFYLLLSIIVHGESKRNYTNELDLGHGFVEKSYWVANSPSHWEAIAHYTTVFYKDREIGMLDGFDISPSARYAIYKDSRSGELRVFDIEKRTETVIPVDEYCLPSQHEWNEEENTITMRCGRPQIGKYYVVIDLLKFRVLKKLERHPDNHALHSTETSSVE